MPGHPDPPVNLALTLERARQSDEAISTYSAALEVYPEYLPAIQGLATLMLRGRTATERRGRPPGMGTRARGAPLRSAHGHAADADPARAGET